VCEGESADTCRSSGRDPGKVTTAVFCVTSSFNAIFICPPPPRRPGTGEAGGGETLVTEGEGTCAPPPVTLIGTTF
jgi:hypothetical protein